MNAVIEDLAALGKDIVVEARLFCLEMIEHYYGISYRPDFHADLDSLLLEGSENWFSPACGGRFWVVQNSKQFVATIGIFDLRKKPATRSRLSHRYPDQLQVCQLVRAYVRPEFQGLGLGTKLVAEAEKGAASEKYKLVYLHADAASIGALSFWHKCGYHEFGMDESAEYVDFEKVTSISP